MAKKQNQMMPVRSKPSKRKRPRRQNPSPMMIALAALLAVGGLAGGYGLYKINQRRKSRMLPGGPEGPTQGATGTMLGYEWLVDSNQIMVRALPDGDWVVIDQAGAKSVEQIEELVIEYLRGVIWQPTNVMPPALRLSGENEVALLLPAGWTTAENATTSSDAIATAEVVNWQEDDGSQTVRVVITPMGTGTAIITAIGAPGMMQARVVVA